MTGINSARKTSPTAYPTVAQVVTLGLAASASFFVGVDGRNHPDANGGVTPFQPVLPQRPHVHGRYLLGSADGDGGSRMSPQLPDGLVSISGQYHYFGSDGADFVVAKKGTSFVDLGKGHDSLVLRTGSWVVIRDNHESFGDSIQTQDKYDHVVIDVREPRPGFAMTTIVVLMVREETEDVITYPKGAMSPVARKFWDTHPTWGIQCAVQLNIVANSPLIESLEKLTGLAKIGSQSNRALIVQDPKKIAEFIPTLHNGTGLPASVFSQAQAHASRFQADAPPSFWWSPLKAVGAVACLMGAAAYGRFLATKKGTPADSSEQADVQMAELATDLQGSGRAHPEG